MLECVCPVWHPHLPKYLSDSNECNQKRALLCISLGRLYKGLLSNLHITSLQERRNSTCEKYFKTISKPGSKLYSLFPASNESGHDTCTKKDFTFLLAWTSHVKNSSSHGTYATFKVKFSNCGSSQFSCVHFLFCYMVCHVYCFYYDFVNVNSTLRLQRK